VHFDCASGRLEVWMALQEVDRSVLRVGVDDREAGDVAVRVGGADHRAFAERRAEVDDGFAGFAAPCHPRVHSGSCLFRGGVCHLLAR
jgi:hypothetical protein